MITTRPLRPTIYFPGGDATAVRRMLEMRIFHKRVARERGSRPAAAHDISNEDGPDSTLSFEQLCASLARSAAIRLQEKEAA
jgi:hypothetical protein